MPRCFDKRVSMVRRGGGRGEVCTRKEGGGGGMKKGRGGEGEYYE